MSFFQYKSKDKQGNREVRFAYIDGISDLFSIPEETVDVKIDTENNKLTITSALNKKRNTSLDLNKITDVRDITETEIKEAEKSVIGRAAVGTLLLGPLGGIIGGMSGVGKKEKKALHHFVIVTYISNGDEKQLIFEIVGASIGWKEFVAELPKDENSPFAAKNTSGTVEL